MPGPVRIKAGAVLGTLALVLPLFGTGHLLAQGVTLNLDFGQRLESVSDDDSEDDGVRTRTNLGFNLQSVTRSQTLTLAGQTGLVYNFSDDTDGVDVESPRLALGYQRQSRNTAFRFGVSYREVDVDDSVFVVDPETEELDLVSGEGQRRTLSYNTSLSLGREGPLRSELSYSYTDVTYSGTTDPSLDDGVTQRVNARVNFRITPTLDTSVFASWRDTDEEEPGGTDTTTFSIGVGADYQVNARTLLIARLSYDDNESVRDGEITRDTNGLGGSIGVSRAMPNGTLGFRISQAETVNGTRNQAQVSRQFELQRGELGFTLGATKTEGFSTQPLVNIVWTYGVDKFSNLTLNLGQSASTTSENVETVRTRLGIEYTRALTERSSLSSGLQFVDQDVLSDGGDDQSSIRLNVTYRHAVGDEWNLVSGVSYSTSRRDTREDEDSSTIFVGLEKSFSFRP